MSFWEKYPDLDRNIEVVKKNILMHTNHKYLGELVKPMVYASGKMLRPAFVFIAGSFGEYEDDRLTEFATVIEILHMATLIHDDIIDDAEYRRGIPSIQARAGKKTAVFMGDYYLCQCFLMLSNYQSEDLNHIAKVMNAICLAEVFQNYNKNNKSMSTRDYLKVISGKTAALFALSFYMGAKVSRCDENLSRLLGKIGKDIGMAFQIIDDILDYSSDRAALGKEGNKDIQQGYFTLPLIYALQQDHKGKLMTLLENESINAEQEQQIYEAINENGGIVNSKNLAKRYVEKAFKSIHLLPEGKSKALLLDLTEKLLNRAY